MAQLRQAAAAARETLLDLAADQWRSSAAHSSRPMARSRIRRQAGRWRFGQLSKGQKLMKAIGAAPLKPPAHWKVAGKPLPKVNGRDIVTGKHQYTPD